MRIALFFELTVKDVLYFNPTVQNLYDKLYEYWESLTDFSKSMNVVTDANGEVMTSKDLDISHDTYIRLMNYLSNFETMVKYTNFDFENIMPVAVFRDDIIRYRVIGEIDFEEVIDDM